MSVSRWVGTLFGLVLCALPGRGEAATAAAASCSYADVSTAISSSSRNGTVTIPACSPTGWTSPLTITKGLIIQGAGMDVTTLRADATMLGGMWHYNPDATAIANDERFEVSGITFDFNNQNFTGGDVAFRLNNTSNTVAITKVVLHDLKFKNTNASERCFGRAVSTGQVYGVMYDSEFVDCEGISGGELGNNEHSWDNFTITPGGQDNFYYEDVTFTGNSFFHNAGQGGRYAVRFSTYNFEPGQFGDVWDVHGNNSPNSYGTMGAEFYRNTINFLGVTGATCIDHRGGVVISFDITVNLDNKCGWLIKEEALDNTSVNPRPMHVNDSYYWGIREGGNLPLWQKTIQCGGGCYIVTENVDWWQEKTSFDGTTGIGVGLLSSRPSTCTTGVGYWATDQGSWNALGADGVLYKCTSTDTWTLYYTPLPYPHPLRTASIDIPPGAPQPPTNPKILQP